MCFHFVLDLVKDQPKLFSQMKNCKAPPSIDTQKAQLIICCIFTRSFPLRLIFFYCVLPQTIEQLHPRAVQIVKNVHMAKI